MEVRSFVSFSIQIQILFLMIIILMKSRRKRKDEIRFCLSIINDLLRLFSIWISWIMIQINVIISIITKFTSTTTIIVWTSAISLSIDISTSTTIITPRWEWREEIILEIKQWRKFNWGYEPVQIANILTLVGTVRSISICWTDTNGL